MNKRISRETLPERRMRASVTVALLVVLPSVAQSQASTVNSESAEQPYCDPHKAQILATIVPGAGYAYTGEYLRGYGTWVMTFIGVTVGPIIFSSDTCGFLFVG